ncbi:MAG: DUF4399 domain-containing protein [Pseudomonadota bacterium]
MKKVLLAAVFVAVSNAALAQGTPAPEDAAVYFVNLENGATVTSPVKVIFGLTGMGIAPAGMERDSTGHHHLLLNRPPLGEGELGAEEFETVVPADDNHLHFGGGQTETVLELPPGDHTLQLVFGDASHIPHANPVKSEVITITVTE